MDRARVIALTLALIAAITGPLCASSGWARGLGVLGLCGGGPAATVQCSTDTDYIGYTGAPSSESPLNVNRLFVRLFAVQCVSGCSSGMLKTPTILHRSATADNVKVCVYEEDGDGVADSGDSLMGCSAQFSATSFGQLATGPDLDIPISCGGSYWVALISDATTFDAGWTTTGTTYYQDSLSYSSPPATLSGSWTAISGRTYKAYVTIGP